MKTLAAPQTVKPRVVRADKAGSNTPAVAAAKAVGTLEEILEHRQVKYLNNLAECDHRRRKWIICCGLGFGCFRTAQQPFSCYEAMHMIGKN